MKKFYKALCRILFKTNSKFDKGERVLVKLFHFNSPFQGTIELVCYNRRVYGKPPFEVPVGWRYKIKNEDTPFNFECWCEEKELEKLN